MIAWNEPNGAANSLFHLVCASRQEHQSPRRSEPLTHPKGVTCHIETGEDPALF